MKPYADVPVVFGECQLRIYGTLTFCYRRSARVNFGTLITRYVNFSTNDTHVGLSVVDKVNILERRNIIINRNTPAAAEVLYVLVVRTKNVGSFISTE